MKKLIEVMQEAGRNGVAIGHFNIADLVLLKGVFEAARELKVPVIVGASEGEREFAGTRQLAAVVRSLREEFDFPIFLNADHTHSLASALAAVKAGFDSVVFEAGCRMRRNATDGNNFCKIRRLRSKPCRKYAQSAAMKSATTLIGRSWTASRFGT